MTITLEPTADTTTSSAEAAYAGWILFEATASQQNIHLARTPIEAFTDPYIQAALRLISDGIVVAGLPTAQIGATLVTALKQNDSGVRPTGGQSWETLVAGWQAAAAYTETQAVQLEERLRSAWQARNAVAALQKGIREIGKGTELAEVSAAVAGALRDTAPDRQALSLQTLLNDCLIRAEDVQEGRIPPGLQTGYRDVDVELAGIQRGNLVVLGARSGVGKTTAALDIARFNARQGRTVVFISLEMDREELAMRITAAESEVLHTDLRTARLDDNAWRKLSVGRTRGEELGENLIILDRGITSLPQIRAAVLAIESVDLVIVDYLQLIASPESRATTYERVSEHVRGIKLLASEAHVPILLLAQLNREVDKRSSPKPMLADLRDSSAIESDADVVLFLYKEDELEKPHAIGEVQLMCAKNRHGRTFEITLANRQHVGKFADLQA